jgi:predicted ABC-class ATPase
VPDADELRRILRRIDGRGYRAYRDIGGAFEISDVGLHVDRVQSDPFAAPSKLRVRIPMQRAALPRDLFESPVRRIALADLLARRVRVEIGKLPGGRRGSGRSGLLAVDAGGQEVLERSAVVLTGDWVEVRLAVGLPAAGRRVLGREAEALLLGDVPGVAERGLCARHLDAEALERFVLCIENQESIRELLPSLGLVAFVGDGSVLPRESGASDRPMRGAGAVAFESPPSLRVTLPLAHPIPGQKVRQHEIQGLGVPTGVTLISPRA